MARIKELFIELKYEVFKNILLITFLKSVIAYYIFYMISSIFDLWYVFSFIFAFSYFTYNLLKKMKQIRIKVFEEHNPEIREMLTTAADNQDKDNIVIAGLFNDVIEKVKKLSSGTLVVPKTLLLLILIIPVFAISSFELTPIRIDALSQDRLIEGIQQIKLFDGLFNKTIEDVDLLGEDLLDEDIFGERRIAKLGNQEINMKMNLGYETDLTNPKEEDTNQVTFKDYPEFDETELLGDDNVQRDNTKEDAKLAREYNEKIRNIR